MLGADILLHEQPHLSQRDLAGIMGKFLGKAKFCLQALIKVGLIKARWAWAQIPSSSGKLHNV